MKPTKEILFYLDAEWVPLANELKGLQDTHPELYTAFIHRCDKWNKEKGDKGESASHSEYYWETQAHWYPELCKIICVSFGWFQDGVLTIKSSYGDDEKKVLEPLVNLFNKVQTKGFIPCGVSITRYDLPWISKRMMSNGLKPPSLISTYGLKPWDVKVFDLTQVWGQGCSQESYTPFEWMCASLGIESSKDDIGGADVKRVYYEEGEAGLERIKTYCEKDVRKTVELAEKLIELMP